MYRAVTGRGDARDAASVCPIDLKGKTYSGKEIVSLQLTPAGLSNDQAGGENYRVGAAATAAETFEQ